VRVERVVLEDHGDVALLRREVGDIALADANHAIADALEAGHESQHGRFAAARRAHEHEQLPISRFEAQVARCDVAVRVDLVDVL